MNWYKKSQSEEVLYHVTHTKNIPKIQQKGLIPLQTSNWAKGSGSRYGEGEIYSFNNMTDAIRWAAKMDWEFNKSMGTGKISIVTFKKENDWDVDENDPLSQSSNKGQWLKRMKMVKPDEIIDITPVTQNIIKSIV